MQVASIASLLVSCRLKRVQGKGKNQAEFSRLHRRASLGWPRPLRSDGYTAAMSPGKKPSASSDGQLLITNRFKNYLLRSMSTRRGCFVSARALDLKSCCDGARFRMPARYVQRSATFLSNARYQWKPHETGYNALHRNSRKYEFSLTACS